METQQELNYRALSFTGKVYHIVLPAIDENRTLCKRKFETTSSNLSVLTGDSLLVHLMNTVLPQIPRPGVPCKQCLRKLAKLQDEKHISGKEYEELVFKKVQRYYEQQGKRILSAKHGESNVWIGQSGCEHQIDVSLELEDEIVLAECKCLKRAVNLSLVLTFLARIIDIKPTVPEKYVHGIIFANIHFQGGSCGNVQKLADYYHDYITLSIVNSYV